jgi:hypothetical protein
MNTPTRTTRSKAPRNGTPYDPPRTFLDACRILRLEALEEEPLHGGRVRCFRIALPGARIDPMPIKRSITVLVPAGGSMPLRFGSTIGFGDPEQLLHRTWVQEDLVRLHRHYSEAGCIEALALRIEDAIAAEGRFLEELHTLAEATLEKETIRRIMLALIKRGFGLEEDEPLTKHSHRQLMRVQRFVEHGVKEDSGTIWGLVCGVVRYTNAGMVPAHRTRDNVLRGRGLTINTIMCEEALLRITAEQRSSATAGTP